MVKKYCFSFLLYAFIASLPFGFAWADNKTTYNGIIGKSYNIIDGKGELAGGCTKEDLGKQCSSAGAKEAICQKYGEKYSCTAKVCKDGYLLELMENGNSKGICRTLQFAKDNCKKILKKKGITCPENQEPYPIEKLKNGSQAYNECFCADKSNLVYSCGDGNGTPPSVDRTFMNIDKITAEQNTSCLKEKAIFENWKCGNKILKPGETFSIEEKTTCVAQWKDCPACVAGDGCTCSVKVVNNECTYDTGVKNSDYVMVSGEKTEKPQCKLRDKCPEEATGNYPNCDCGPDKDYDRGTNKCVPKCDAAIARWDNNKNACICLKEPDKRVYGWYVTTGEYKCVCGDNLVDEGGRCMPTDEQKCKDGGGEWHDGECKCEGNVEGAHWHIDIQQCDCDEYGQEIKDGKCVTPTACPDDATGKYPGECECKDKDSVYNSGNNTCVKKEPEPEEQKPCSDILSQYPNAIEVSGTQPDCKITKCEDGYILENNSCTEDPKKKECEAGGGTWENGVCKCADGEVWDEEDKKCLDKVEQARKKYEAAKAKEQSKENRMLTAATLAATGIGGMELAMGLSEQKADKDADMDMTAHLATMRCTYADGKQVKAGPEEIELPGGNDATMMQLREEYFALAEDLKVRKIALGMAPGIESEVILDNSEMDLYDDESIGIDTGAYASLYRAKALNSEADQAKIDEEQKASKNRVIAGATVAGVGVVGSIIADSAINGKIAEKIKERKESKDSEKLTFDNPNFVLDKGQTVSTLTEEELNQLIKNYKSK